MLVKLRRVWIQLTADRKRFAALCAALMIGMLLWARLIVVSRMPRMAVATEAAGQSPLVAPSQATADPADAPPVAIRLETLPNHDPFVISPEHFPKPKSMAETAPVAGKSDAEPAEDTYQIEARFTAALRTIIERLRLEAVVSGSLVVINGRTYRIGESLVWIPESGSGAQTMQPIEFRVQEVKQRSAVLECQGRRFEMQMTSPGG